jgi:protocatechuate 3,4-dioxygenase beta subunit
VNVDAAAAWATGGTAAMSGNYPDPFASGLGTACDLTCSATIGPCYAVSPTRQDISEGQDGLPVRLAFLIVDESCNPVPGATIEIWHCSPAGVYSGNESDSATLDVAFCTGNDATAQASRFFRGIQTADANGRVDFDTCFPGWYSSRTIHIHFIVRVNGTEYVTSQFVFDDALDDEIVATQPLYNTRGARDTTNATDNVVSADTAAAYSFQTQRMADGAMLAWKAIVVRSSTSAALCNIGNMNGGPGGPGGDGGMMGPPPGDGGFPPPDGG